MQREHLEMCFPANFKKKHILNISNLASESIAISVFTDLMVQKMRQKSIIKSRNTNLMAQIGSYVHR